MTDDYLVPKFNFDIPRIDPSIFKTPQFIKNAEQGIASEFHKRLIKWINDFHTSLDEEHEVGVRLVSFGQSIVFHLDNIGYWNPYLISFSGITEDGQPVELIQHVNQISILLMKLPRKIQHNPKDQLDLLQTLRRKITSLNKSLKADPEQCWFELAKLCGRAT